MASPKDPTDSKDSKPARTAAPRAPRAKPASVKAAGLSELKTISKARVEQAEAPAAAPAADAAAAEDSNAQKLDRFGRAYATGKRKNNATAKVWLKPGTGKITINERALEVYFARPVLQMIVRQPFGVVDRAGQFDVIISVSGGGLSGQAGAVKHGISKALIRYEPELRPVLKRAGFLTRDPRIVERKKYGKPKARRSFQFSKR